MGVSHTLWRNLENPSHNSFENNWIRKKAGSANRVAEPRSWRNTFDEIGKIANLPGIPEQI